MHQFQSSYLACCLQCRRKGQWTMQLEELLDKLKQETNKQKNNMILQLNKHVNVRELKSIMVINKCNSTKRTKHTH